MTKSRQLIFLLIIAGLTPLMKIQARENYLLNAGPDAKGVIPAESIERLRNIGAWMRVNGEAIYGTTANPFHKLTWGRATKKITDGRTTLFLHVFDWPADGKLVVPGLRSKVGSARLLATEARIKARATGRSVTLDIPREAPDPIVSVIALELRTPLEVERILPSADKTGAIALPAAYANIHNNIRARARLGSPPRARTNSSSSQTPGSGPGSS
ncbi:MAG: alpha-L-fucosidase [Opitutaceae bacterium]